MVISKNEPDIDYKAFARKLVRGYRALKAQFALNPNLPYELAEEAYDRSRKAIAEDPTP